MTKSNIHAVFTVSIPTITTYQSGVIQSRAHRNLKKVTDDALKPHGLTATHWLVIGMVLDSGPDGIRITELAKQTDTTLSFLTHTINLLESKGILVRIDHITDSRSKMVSVSPGYVQKCALIEQDLRHKLRDSIYARVSPDKLQSYIDVLYEFAKLDSQE